MDNGFLIALVSLAVTGLFLIGVPIFLVIGMWVVGVSLVIDSPWPTLASRSSKA